ncbi:C4-dicarboxylate transport protein [Leminorella grimontii]|uniref:C4-dicarboxylate transport protein n=1 Tax=Leminorella grimontii TaxID=82981 RepID=A0AAV5N834_9GAMM|nr:cation:dicarboxylase symporter family transporter [Leminorella grimontii]KFC98411.1 aerobic C4-dicarboxylate transporter [Leminorella grimontii ATCC 33999 = DSM 5078]GKX57244.1 C4-dicarboxylate transport protein [Leminorella grimontii]GKX61322.1 C4-dicarboxylate transport protein [Leminorella grimontii]VFS55895.1 Aerobic C4-dicarboxylate transport protein [Leminorella grimontii]
MTNHTHTLEQEASSYASSPPKKAFWKGLGFQIAVSMILGILVGFLWPEFATSLKLLGDIFLRLIKSAVAPLIFLTVALGIGAAGDIKQVGKVGLSAIIYFEIVSTIAILFGFGMGELFSVGSGTVLAEGSVSAQASSLIQASHASPKSFAQFFLEIFPDSFMGAFSSNNLLQVLVLALMFGFGILLLKEKERVVVEKGLNFIAHAFFKFIHVIMLLAPIGTFGAIAYAVGSNGVDMLIKLTWLVAAFYITLILFVVVVLGAVCLVFKLNLFDIIKFIKEELYITFGTASSESVLPRLLEKLPKYGVSRQTVGLVLPTGYAFNLDGTSIYMSMGVIFLANAYGIPLSLDQLFGILLIMLLTSKGAATVSGGAFVVFAATITTTGLLPLEGVAVMFGVYRFMSMALAVTNIIGNTVATIAVAKINREYHPSRRQQLDDDE